MTIIAQALNPAGNIDYAWLLQYAADWSHRSDLAERMPMFILLAEKRIKTLLDERIQDTVNTITTSAGLPYAFLPGDLLHVRAITIPGSTPALDYVAPDVFNQRYEASISGVPRAYTIIGEQLYLGPTPDEAYSLSVTYKAEFAPLSEANPTNGLIEKWPDVYLWGVMREVAKFCRDAEMAVVYENDFQSAINNVNLLSWKTPGLLTVKSDVRSV